MFIEIVKLIRLSIISWYLDNILYKMMDNRGVY